MKIQSKTFLLVILSFQSNLIVVHQMIDIIYPPFHAIFFSCYKSSFLCLETAILSLTFIYSQHYFSKLLTFLCCRKEIFYREQNRRGMLFESTISDCVRVADYWVTSHCFEISRRERMKVMI